MLLSPFVTEVCYRRWRSLTIYCSLLLGEGGLLLKSIVVAFNVCFLILKYSYHFLTRDVYCEFSICFYLYRL